MRINKAYQQGPEEDFRDWKFRLLKGKKKGQYNLSYDDIGAILGMPESAETLKKMAEVLVDHEDYVQPKSEIDTPMRIERKDELEQKTRELELEKVKVSDQRRENSKILRETARLDEIKRVVAEMVQDLKKEKPLKFVKRKKQTGEREAVLLLSDWHKGSWQNNTWNVFNEAEMRRRIELLVTEAIEYCKMNKVGKVHIFLMGDLINGMIHVSTRVMSNENAVKQTQGAVSYICDIIKELASHFEEVKVYGVRGNHERMTPKKQEAVSGESFYDLMPWFLEPYFQNVDNVEIVENEIGDNEIVYTQICGYEVAATHGDKDKVDKVAYNLTMMTRKVLDYVFMAHYHKTYEDEAHGCEIIGNPSLCGVDEYARDIRKTAKPAQKLLIFEPKKGRICTYNINLSGENEVGL